METFVIKTKQGAFVEEHSNEEELNFVFTSVEKAKKYSVNEIKTIRHKYLETWLERNLEVHEVIMTTEHRQQWYSL